MKINYNEVYPIDIYGIAKIGVENWLENYKPPFDPVLYKERHLEIFQKFISIACTGKDDKINKFFIANFKIVLLILEVSTKYQMVESLKNQYKYFQSKTLNKFEDIPFLELNTSLAKLYANSRKSFKDSLRSYSKNIFLFVKYSSRLRTKNRIYYQGTFNLDIANFIISNKKYPIFLNPSLSSNSLSSTFFPNEIKSKIDLLLGQYKFLSRNEVAVIKKSINKILQYNWSIYENLLQNIKPNGHLLLSNGNGYINHRLIIAAWKINGGKSIGFAHGNSDFTSYSPEYIGYDGLSICDKFVCKTIVQKKQLERSIKDFAGSLNCAKIILQK